MVLPTPKEWVVTKRFRETLNTVRGSRFLSTVHSCPVSNLGLQKEKVELYLERERKLFFDWHIFRQIIDVEKKVKNNKQRFETRFVRGPSKQNSRRTKITAEDLFLKYWIKLEWNMILKFQFSNFTSTRQCSTKSAYFKSQHCFKMSNSP